MSYDFSMEAPLGPDGSMVSVGDFDMNYTYNVSPMFRLALGGNGVNDLHGCVGSEAIPRLRAAIADMEDRPSVYRAMNPDNGWGDYEGALGVLKRLCDWCVAAPMAHIRIS